MVVDAFIETSVDGADSWKRSSDWNIGKSDSFGPWSVPHAVELGRHAWATLLRVAQSNHAEVAVRIRVIDTAGVVVEQWPKR